MDIDEKYKPYYKEDSRHLDEGTLKIIYRPWNDFDVIEVWAVSPNPLKNVKLGYGFYNDFNRDDDYVRGTYSVSTDVTKNVPKEGITITIISYDEAVRRAKCINWSNIKVVR